MLINPYILQLVASDADAKAFLAAASITDPTITSAIDTFVIGLKADSLWTKITAIYPFVGGTASTHKWNLKNPLDTDAAYRLVFSGTFTHDANGIQGSGDSVYADTFINPSVVTTNAQHMSAYIRTPSTSQQYYEIAAFQVTPTIEYGLVGRYSNGTAYSIFGGISSVTLSDPRGFLVATRSGSNNALYKNATSLVNSVATLTYPNAKIGVSGAVGRTGFASNRNLSFASIGQALTAGDVTSFNTRVQALQTTLSRNV